MENSEKDINAEIIDQLIIKVGELEKRDVKPADHSEDFKSLKELLEQFVKQHNDHGEVLRGILSHLGEGNSIDESKNMLAEIKVILQVIQSAIPIEHQHHFDLKSKGWIIAGMLLLIVTSISVGLCGFLWVRNNDLAVIDIKYRLLRGVAVTETNWADSVYAINPGEAEKMAVKMDNPNQRNEVQTPNHSLVKKKVKKRKADQ